jgi:hypothetical protein
MVSCWVGRTRIEEREPFRSSACSLHASRNTLHTHWSDARTKLADCFNSLLAVAFREERQAGGVAMEEVPPADRADFALRKEAGEGNRP